MSEFTIRSDSVNVEQIMRQIRARIREKRGVDYTEQEIRELAAAKLEKFLDPENVRSELLQEFRRVQQAAPPLPNYEFEDTTLFASHRAPIRWLRRMTLPLLKLFFNPNPLIQALHIQSELNARFAREMRERADLSYEVMHNLVVELTRLAIEVKNVKMRVESLSSRLDFDERRARALEGVVQYRAAAPPGPAAVADTEEEPEGGRDEADSAPGAPGRGRRRRRRRGRKGGLGRATPGIDSSRQAGHEDEAGSTVVPAEAPGAERQPGAAPGREGGARPEALPPGSREPGETGDRSPQDGGTPTPSDARHGTGSDR